MKLKKIFLILFVVVMMLCLCIPAFAEDGNVSYAGDAEKFIFSPGSEYSPTDLFDNFKSVMPGDSLTQKILVCNDLKNEVDIKIYMRSLGAQLETNEFLSQMTLTVKQDGGSELYEAPADQTAQLTDWVCLGTVHSGGKVTLDVMLDVPIDMDNGFQEAIGYLDWEFKVEEIPEEPVIPLVPDTGDDSNVVLWMFIMILAAGTIITAIEVVKKKNCGE